MTLKEAVKLLDLYNRWRRGSEIEQPNPTKIGIALDMVILELKQKEV